MHSKIGVVFLLFNLLACKNSNSQFQRINNMPVITYEENPYPKIAAIPVPTGFERVKTTENSFAQWLQNIPLKKEKTVYLFNGSKKINQEAQFVVLDIPIGNKDLQQCADAVMRLRAMYLYDMGKFDAILFYDNNGISYRFDAPYNPEHFNKYLELVFGMCGTASLSKQLHPVSIMEIAPGNVFIRGGFPGHAEMVVDMAINKYGKKIFLLAQSYMPAQDIHILKNPANTTLSPWYEVNSDEIIETPEFTFRNNELKGW